MTHADPMTRTTVRAARTAHLALALALSLAVAGCTRAPKTAAPSQADTSSERASTVDETAPAEWRRDPLLEMGACVKEPVVVPTCGEDEAEGEALAASR